MDRTDSVERSDRRHPGLSALVFMALLALLPAACGPERDPVEADVQARSAVAQPAG